jgi:hypothetical protein
MPYGEMDFASLFCVSRSMEGSLFFLFNGLLLMIPAIDCVDLPVLLLFLL